MRAPSSRRPRFLPVQPIAVRLVRVAVGDGDGDGFSGGVVGVVLVAFVLFVFSSALFVLCVATNRINRSKSQRDHHRFNCCDVDLQAPPTSELKLSVRTDLH